MLYFLRFVLLGVIAKNSGHFSLRVEVFPTAVKSQLGTKDLSHLEMESESGICRTEDSSAEAYMRDTIIASRTVDIMEGLKLSSRSEGRTCYFFHCRGKSCRKCGGRLYNSCQT